MRARRLGAGAAAFAVAPAACAPLPITRAAPRDRPIEVACCGLPGPPVEFVYLGVGGWLVRRGGSAILFAPLFSNPSLTRAGFSGIAPDTVRIERALDSLAVDLSEVSLILSGHGHYDHLMDVPYVMTRHAPGARLLANRTSAHQIASWGLADRITVVDDSAGDRQSAGRWIRFGDVRVMPFRSRHARDHGFDHVLPAVLCRNRCTLNTLLRPWQAPQDACTISRPAPSGSSRCCRR